MKIHKDYRSLVRSAVKRGWRLDLTGSGHLRLRPPRGRAIVFPATPSDKRGLRNTRATLRRAGLDV